MTGTEKLNILTKYPELVPLSDEQKESFLYLWKAMPDYARRQKLIGSIPDLYNNRQRYKALLTDKEDIQMFNRIMLDDDTLF